MLVVHEASPSDTSRSLLPIVVVVVVAAARRDKKMPGARARGLVVDIRRHHRRSCCRRRLCATRYENAGRLCLRPVVVVAAVA